MVYVCRGIDVCVNNNSFVLIGRHEHKRDATVVATGYQFGRCLASQMDRSFVYDCEYFGGVERPVFTPLTERVFLSLTSAIKSFHCGVLTGDAGIGKCQIVADLAMVSVIFTCCFQFPFYCYAFDFIFQFIVELIESLPFVGPRAVSK